MRVEPNLAVNEILAAAVRNQVQAGVFQGRGFESFLQAGTSSQQHPRQSGQGQQLSGRPAQNAVAQPANNQSQTAVIRNTPQQLGEESARPLLQANQTAPEASDATWLEPGVGEAPQGTGNRALETDEVGQAGNFNGDHDEALTDESEIPAYQLMLLDIASALGATPERISEALDGLGLELHQLQDSPQNLSLLLQAALEAEPAQLLAIPGITDVYAEVEAAVHEHMEQLLLQTGESQAAGGQPVAVAEQPLQEGLQQAAYQPLVAEGSEDQQAAPLVQQASSNTGEVPTQNANSSNEESANPDSGHSFEQAQTTPIQHAPNPQEQPTRIEVTQSGDGVVVLTQTSTGQPVRVVSMAPSPASADVVRQLVEQMRLDMRGGMVNEMKLTLRPESLGEISLRILTHNSIVTAQFIAENSRVRDIIEANMAELRQALEEQGIQVSELNVSVDTSADERMRQLFEQQAENSGRHTTADSEQAEAQDETEAGTAQTFISREGSTVEFSA